MKIQANSDLATPLLIRLARLGITLEISSEISGFVIQIPGEDDVVGTERGEFMRAIVDIRKRLR